MGAASVPKGPTKVPTAAWVVLASGVCAALHVGKLPPAITTLQAQVGLSLTEAGFLLSFVQLAGMTLGLPVGLVADRWGLRRSLLTGLALLTAGSLAGGQTSSVTLLLTLRGVEGLGLLLVALPAPALLRRLVPPGSVSTMLGFWGAYMPIGTATAILIGTSIITAYDWRAWWMGLGLTALAMMVAVWAKVPADTARELASASAHTQARSSTAAVSESLRRTLTSPVPWLLAACFAVYSSQWLAVIGFLPTMYAEAAIPVRWIALLSAFAAGINLTGNILSGRLLSAGYSPQTLLWAGYAGLAIGAWLAFGGVEGSVFSIRYLGVCVFSAVGGLVPGTLFSLAVRLAPRADAVSTTVGWMQQWSSAGQFLGPPAVAWLAAVNGHWNSTWMLTGICSLLGSALVWKLLTTTRMASATDPSGAS